jgi:hypothetical protein
MRSAPGAGPRVHGAGVLAFGRGVPAGVGGGFAPGSPCEGRRWSTPRRKIVENNLENNY